MILSNYIFLLNNNFFANLVFNPADAYALDVMLLSGLYDKNIIFYVGLISHFFAILINYTIGRALRLLEKQKFMEDQYDSLQNAEKKFSFYGYFVVIFSFLPLWGGLFSALTGAMKFSFRYFLLLSFTGLALSYGVKFYWV